MTDYRPLLARAIEALDPNTGEARRAVYDRARTALVNQLRGLNPPLAEADITRERLSLEDAIRRVEGEANVPPAMAPQAPRGDQRPRQPPPPPRQAPPPASAPQPQAPARAGVEPEFDELEQFEGEAPPPPPRDPRGPRRTDPRDPRGPRPEPSLRPRGARSRSPADYAREEARRASRTKFVVFGLILLLVILATIVGYVNRDRILSLVLGKMPATTAQQQQDETHPNPSKANDRVPQTQQQTQAPITTQPVVGSNRALLFEENPGTQQFTSVAGTVSWRTETVPGRGGTPELAVRAEVDVPDRKLKVVFTIRRNPEASSSASHYVEIQFTGNDSFGGIAQVPVVRAKSNESAQGFPLTGVSIRIVQGLFLIGLSAVDADRDRNLQALRTQPWIDIPFIYDNGRRSVIAFEKGPAGESAMAEAFAAWTN